MEILLEPIDLQNNRNCLQVSLGNFKSNKIDGVANDEEQKVQEAIKAITVSKASIEQYKKEIDKIKATISVYNELYV